MRKRMLLTAAVLLLCTGCGTIPPPDTAELIPTAPVTETPTEPAPTEPPPTEPPTERAAAPAMPTDASAPSEEAETEPPTEAPTEPAEPWQAAYRSLLTTKCRMSSQSDAYFALIRLDADNIPELVVLDDVYMELYCFDGSRAELLLEDGYKGAAVDGQNVCYQPEKSLFATAFSTMGGGSGFTILRYEQLDTLHVERYYFNNNENVDGEMPYNRIWDRAEEFEVSDNGYHDVTLGKSWVHIGTDFEGLEPLTDASAARAGADWENPEDPQDPTA